MLAALIIVAYSNSWTGDFVMDDIQEIENNPRLTCRQGLYAAAFEGNGMPARPIAYLTFAANVVMFGEWRPSFHFVNIVLHSACAFLLFRLSARTLRQCWPHVADGRGFSSEQVALMVTAIWSVHPLHTQVVTYVYQRIELLVSFFALLTVHQFFRFRDSGNWLTYGVSLVSCALGMLTKENMVVVPFLLAAWDFIESGNTFAEYLRNQLRLLIPHFSTITFLVFVVYVQSQSYGEFTNPAFGRLEYFVLENVIQFWYVTKILWPSGLCLQHESTLVAFSWPTLLATGIVLVLWGATVWLLVRRQLAAMFGVLFFGLLAPTSSFQPVQALIMEHRPYLASFVIILGFWLSLRWVLPVCASTFKSFGLTRLATPDPRIFAFIIACAFVVQTRWRNSDYQSRVHIWEQSRRLYPDSDFAHKMLLIAYQTTGLDEKALALATEVLATPANPGRSRDLLLESLARSIVGLAYLESEDIENARQQFEKSVEMDPRQSGTLVNLARTVRDTNPDRAILLLMRALEIRPYDAPARNNLANELARRGRFDQSLAQFDILLHQYPDREDIARNRQTVLEMRRINETQP